MKKLVFSLVMVSFFQASTLRAEQGNLGDENTSLLTPARVQGGGKIAVDIGLLYVLNKYVRGAEGSQRAALEKASQELEAAANKYAELGKNSRQNAKAIETLEQLMKDRAHHSGQYVENGGRLLDAGGAVKGAAPKHLSNLELAGIELLEARDRAVAALRNTSEEAGHFQQLLRTKHGHFRVIRFLGSMMLVADIAGTGWAIYDNSKTPIALGGIQKLSEEIQDDIFQNLENKRVRSNQIESLPHKSAAPSRERTRDSAPPSKSKQKMAGTHR